MYQFFPDNYTWTFRTHGLFCESVYGGGAHGEIMQVVERLNSKQPESWYREWEAMADKVAALAGEAKGAGLARIASQRFLRAAKYYQAAEFFVPVGDPKRMASYQKSIDFFQQGIEPLGNVEVLKVPYENSFLPAYYVNASTKGEKRPAMVMFGGLDSTKEQHYFAIGRACPEHGLSILLVDGPGQGGAIRLNGIPTRYDYEVPAKAAFDYLETRSDVDLKRVALMAWSMGGYYAPRAAAFEKRYAACIAWGAQYDFEEIWNKRPDDYPLAIYLMWILNVDNMKDARQLLKKFKLRDVAPLIECPTLILHGENDQQIPLQDAYSTFNLLRCPKKLKVFTKENGGDQHCQLDNLQLAREEIFGWLTELFAPGK